MANNVISCTSAYARKYDNIRQETVEWSCRKSIEARHKGNKTILWNQQIKTDGNVPKIKRTSQSVIMKEKQFC